MLFALISRVRAFQRSPRKCILEAYFHIISGNKTMSTLVKRNPLIAVCQMTAKSDKEENFHVCQSLIEKAGDRNAQMVFLPECFDIIGEKREQAIQAAESLDGPLLQRYKSLAQKHNLWLSLGGFHEKGPESSLKIYNSHIIISSKGEIVSVYRKLHLFNVDIPGSVRLQESEYVIAGSEVVPPVQTPVGKVGLGICYDMRFPEFCISLAKSGAEILTYPSAFTQTTGMAHWETLLRTRAIESQSYVVAAAQTGRHNPKRVSYGHAMVVDPWGCVIACSPDTTDILLAEIDLSYVAKVRLEMPVFAHRRPAIYGEVLAARSTEDIDVPKEYQFGQVTLKSSQLFYKTRLSMAFVNKKPVLPGHVLVSPLRCAERLGDLTSPEVSDLFAVVQKVQHVIEEVHNATSSTVCIQDGEYAGQSINHLHVHVLPRKPTDFPNENDIYKKLQYEGARKDAVWRTDEDMAKESSKLRPHFL